MGGDSKCKGEGEGSLYEEGEGEGGEAEEAVRKACLF